MTKNSDVASIDNELGIQRQLYFVDVKDIDRAKKIISDFKDERELKRVDEVYNPETLIEDIFIPINQSKA